MPALLPDVDPDGLLEYSVVFTDRALNHMSARFQAVMRELDAMLKDTYKADTVALVPGGGSYAMEAVARQLATGKQAMVLRNGLFSHRWVQIFEAGQIPSGVTVLDARPARQGRQAPYVPAPLDEVLAAIAAERPAAVFAPHVETSAGLMLPDGYLRAVAEAVHAAGGLLVLDCVASGAAWVDMADVGVDVLISAPQKGWSAPPSCGMVMLSAAGRAAVEASTSTSFANDLRRWVQIMDAYLAGGHAYHATLPTDALRVLRDAVAEARAAGLETLRAAQHELGARCRALLAERGFPSVAAEGFHAPGVVVCYTDDPDTKSGRRFARAGLQIAGGVPLRVGEPDDFSTFRVGLFGLDKLSDVDAAVQRLADALARLEA